MNKDGKDMLWWRIVGLADLILHEKIDMEEYNIELLSCNNEVSRLVPNQIQDELENFQQIEENKEDLKKDLFRLSF